jgi:hypothetical protein
MRKLLILIFGLLVFGFAPNSAFAARSITNGITVSPAIEQITVNKNQDSATFNVEIINNTNSPQFITVSSQDFTYLNESGAVSFYNSSVVNSSDIHGLTSYLKIGYPEIALATRQSKIVPITVVNANLLSSGGHYAAIVFRAYPTNQKKTNFSLVQAVSSLVFLSTNGSGTQKVSLVNALIGSLNINLPQQVSLILQNSGNTQTIPSGFIQILNPGGKLVSQSQINVFSGLILPASRRLLITNIAPANKFLWPGFYKVKVFYSHQGSNSYTIYQKQIFVITEPFLVVIIAVVLALIFWRYYRNNR